jgi:hypothetical protein
MTRSDMNFHIPNYDNSGYQDLDLLAKTVQSVGKSKLKE